MLLAQSGVVVIWQHGVVVITCVVHADGPSSILTFPMLLHSLARCFTVYRYPGTLGNDCLQKHSLQKGSTCAKVNSRHRPDQHRLDQVRRAGPSSSVLAGLKDHERGWAPRQWSFMIWHTFTFFDDARSATSVWQVLVRKSLTSYY